MKFPITRESLQVFNCKENMIQKEIAKILEDLCKDFEMDMPYNYKEKKYVWKQLNTIRQFDIQTSNQDECVPGSTQDKYLPQFIEKLKELFVGCDIIIDPLKTYVIIDWS